MAASLETSLHLRMLSQEHLRTGSLGQWKLLQEKNIFLAEELSDREIITQPVLHERHPYWYAQLSKRKVGEVAYWVG